MLRYKADRRAVAYMLITTALLVVQWNLESFNPFLFALAMFMAVAVAVMAHNHNHLPMWRSSFMNTLTDYWLTLFYGFPAFGWIPTHNKNHHMLNNREGDYTITYRVSESNNIFTLLSYPTISSYNQQKPIRDYLKQLWGTDRTKFYLSFLQYIALAVFYVVLALIDWKKTLIYVFIPHQMALFSILIFNYLQHVHADEESEFNHSRNFISPILNALLFNNGYHTAHHEKAGVHWSKTPELHNKMYKDKIDPSLNERSFWGYLARTYVLAPFSKRFESHSMRLERMRKQVV